MTTTPQTETWLETNVGHLAENIDCPSCGYFVGTDRPVAKRYGNGWNGEAFHVHCADCIKTGAEPCIFFARFGEHARMFGEDQPASCCDYDWPEGYDPS